MKIIKHDVGNQFQEIEIVNMGDLHIGDAEFNEKLLKDEIEKIKNIPNRYVILHGDLINNAIRNSVSDVYTEKKSPEEQLEYLIETFEPIKEKILGISQGNHEFRTYRETGIDISKLFASSLGLRHLYDPEGALVFVSFGKNKYRESIRHVVSLYFTHIGGTKARLINMADIVDADIYFRGHYHNVEVKKMDVFRTDKRYKTIHRETKAFAQSGACLNYGGYSHMKGFAPGSSVFPVAVVSIESNRNSEFIKVSINS